MQIIRLFGQLRERHLYRVRFFALLATLALCACSTRPQPNLDRLYETSVAHADQLPVILLHGAFGARHLYRFVYERTRIFTWNAHADSYGH